MEIGILIVFLGEDIQSLGVVESVSSYFISYVIFE